MMGLLLGRHGNYKVGATLIVGAGFCEFLGLEKLIASLFGL